MTLPLRPDVLVPAARRLFVLFGGICAVVVVGGLALAALGAASPSRAVSLGFYGVGAFLVLGGFLIGNRGPYRARGTGERLGRDVRRATEDDTRTSVNMAFLLTVLGFVLLALGVVVDSRVSLI